MKYRIPAILMLMISFNLYAEDGGTYRAISIPNTFFSNDSSGFTTSKIGFGIYPNYQDPGHYAGFNYQNNHFDVNQWSANGQQLSFVYNQYDLKNFVGYNANLGVNTINGSHLLVTESQISFKLNDPTYLQLILNRDRIETEPSIQNGIFYTLTGVSLSRQFTDRFSAVGLLGLTSISDNNKRWIFKGKLVYALIPDQGINLQLRYRQYKDSSTNTNNYYFNPSDYNETMAAVGIKRWLSGWLFTGTAGVGRQYVTGVPSTTTKLVELSADSPLFSKVFFRARVGYLNANEFLGPTYNYKYWMNELIFVY